MAIATPPTGVSNGELIRWSFEQLNRHDVSALRQFWDHASVERFPDRTCHGADEIAGYFEDTFAAVPDMRIEVISIVEQGDDVFAHWKLTGTQNGPVQGIAPTGKPIALDGIDHFVLRDGKVVSNFVVFDQMQYSRQIGILPQQASVADKAMKAAFNARTRLARRLRRYARRTTS
ncbi:MAG: ester cyclase [Actinomycetota bacterium]|nr:ester cyclase [Actinomycetota bacterium]